MGGADSDYDRDEHDWGPKPAPALNEYRRMRDLVTQLRPTIVELADSGLSKAAQELADLMGFDTVKATIERTRIELSRLRQRRDGLHSEHAQASKAAAECYDRLERLNRLYHGDD